MAASTAPRSSSSTSCHSTPARSVPNGTGVSGRRHPSMGCPSGRRRSSRWPPTNPAAPVTRMGPCTPLRAEARPVLRLVVLAEHGILLLDRPPPPLVGLVPGDGLFEPAIELRLGRPAEAVEPRRVERVAAVMAQAVRDRPDERRGSIEQCEDAVREIYVLDLVAAADVVHLAVLSALDDDVDAAAVIGDEQPVPHMLPVAVERHRQPVDRIRNEERNDLLGELVRAVIVR